VDFGAATVVTRHAGRHAGEPVIGDRRTNATGMAVVVGKSSTITSIQGLKDKKVKHLRAL
jgi:ABC-type nitrate/sulfonate/bicarbonate transport system substrate-binding protein